MLVSIRLVNIPYRITCVCFELYIFRIYNVLDRKGVYLLRAVSALRTCHTYLGRVCTIRVYVNYTFIFCRKSFCLFHIKNLLLIG